MFDVEPLKPKIVEICRQAKVSRLDLIGPAASGDCLGESEVDVLVRFLHDGGEIFNRFFDLKEGLEEVFGRTVDVTVEETIRSPVVWENIEHNRRNIYAL
ncbi:MAG TPA: nucleotidyltransferase domain-containing protein [Sedimentisphaerales bacterium]|nr:nucleotidyltransferase domain-containing protein [Phycisphaerae bacterium]HON92620.1 nucleotidyltransferase domain-containing protein [Sedimentisphaerales bacterium]HOV77710.1 nucleotidyltransferase domain-containing protein [Sedimentisphaerales bacterium]HQI26623.1 nucleotidyltransferase domain-containing protein [Sedimentisphaerales bacterium]